jgi:hypothetical protein
MNTPIAKKIVNPQTDQRRTQMFCWEKRLTKLSYGAYALMENRNGLLSLMAKLVRKRFGTGEK